MSIDPTDPNQIEYDRSHLEDEEVSLIVEDNATLIIFPEGDIAVLPQEFPQEEN